MAKPVRLAVIGRGRWGKNIIKTLEAMPGCVVAYAVARNYTELLKKNDIDGVVVATPSSTHAKVALPFIQKGLSTFIEKPMTTSLMNARRIMAASRKHKTPVFVGHIHLYNPAYLIAKKVIRRVGKLHVLVGEGMSFGPFRGDASAMWDWAPHDLSMMLDITGTMPTSVQAWGKAVLRPKTRLHNITYMKLNFPSGIVGIIHSSKISPEKKKRLTVVGSRSTVVYEDSAEKKVAVYKKGMTPTIFPSYPAAMPLAEEMKAFVQTVKTRKKPKTDVLQGLEVVAILEAAEKSIGQDGKRVRIKR